MLELAYRALLACTICIIDYRIIIWSAKRYGPQHNKTNNAVNTFYNPPWILSHQTQDILNIFTDTTMGSACM